MVKAPTHEEARTWVDGLKTRQGSMVDLDSIVPEPVAVATTTTSSDATEDTDYPNLNAKSWTKPQTEQSDECSGCAECCSIQ